VRLVRVKRDGVRWRFPLIRKKALLYSEVLPHSFLGNNTDFFVDIVGNKLERVFWYEVIPTD